MVGKISVTTSLEVFKSSISSEEINKNEKINAEPFIEQPQNQTNKNEALVDIQKVVEGMNQFVQPSHTHLSFKLHEKLDKYYVTIVDTETDKTIKEIPPKKLLDMYASMLEFIGVIVDEKI